ncbi:vWA domain-containing protein [Propionibacteriaceae bacterium Y1685]
MDRNTRTGVRNTVRRWFALFLMAGLFGTVAAAGASSSTARAADGAVDVYGGCMVNNKAGDLLIMIDESESLKENDPRNERVSAAKYLLERLTGFASRTKVDLQVSVAGFSHNYSEAQPWTKLDNAGRDRTNATIDSFAGDRGHGFETDYWVGLEGARKALAAHNPKGDRCQALVWITDGELDVDFRDSGEERDKYGENKPYVDGRIDNEDKARKAEVEAERQICRDGGLADQLRSSKITLFGVGLRGTGQPDYTLLKSIALGGDAGGKHCGKVTKPPGNFTEAANIDDLLFEFDKFDDPSKQRKTTESGVCQGQPCPESRHTFVLDDSIQSVHVLGNAQADQLEAYLVTPGEKEVKLEKKQVGQSSETTSGGTTINWTWQSERTVVADLTGGAGAEGWSGPWSVVFVDPTASSPDAKSRTAISISGDVYPAWPAAKETTLRSGDVHDLQLGLVNADGETVDPAKLLGQAGMNVSFEGADGQTTEIAKGLGREQITQPQKLDLTNVQPGPGNLVLTLSITTADAKTAKGAVVKGTKLEPQTVRVPMNVEAPAGFPTVAGQVNFGSHEGPAEGAQAELAVTGPGCVWLEAGGSPEIIAGPEKLGDITFASTHDSAENCLVVEEGQTASLPLTLTTTEVDNGTLNAQIKVKVAPKDQPDKAQDAPVTATADFSKPLNKLNFALALIVALILGPGIPIGLLYLMKYLTAKIPGRPLLAQEFGVEIQAGQVLRDGKPFELQPRDLTTMVPLDNGGSRTARAGSTTLNAKMGGSPFGTGHVVVDAPGRIGASSEHTRPFGKTHAAKLPLNVHNHWVLLHNPAGPAEQATVLLLVGGDAPATTRERLVDDLSSRAPEVLEGMRHQVGAVAGQQAAGGADPFGGGAPGPDNGPQPFDFGPDLPNGGQPFAGPQMQSSAPQMQSSAPQMQQSAPHWQPSAAPHDDEAGQSTHLAPAPGQQGMFQPGSYEPGQQGQAPQGQQPQGQRPQAPQPPPPGPAQGGPGNTGPANPFDFGDTPRH